MDVGINQNIFITGLENEIKYWDCNTKQWVMTFSDAHNEPVSSVKITPDEKYIVSTS